jgi:hypothetical protein
VIFCSTYANGQWAKDLELLCFKLLIIIECFYGKLVLFVELIYNDLSAYGTDVMV